MPNIDYYLTSSAEITKKDLKYKSKTPLLTPDIDLGARKFNKSQLNALKLLLCNCVKHGHRDDGVFFYSRDKNFKIPLKYNPSRVSNNSLITVIESLTKARLLESFKAPPRMKGVPKQNLTSSFTSTPQIIFFADSLGITKDTVGDISARYSVRLRTLKPNDDLLEYKPTEYTAHIEMITQNYTHALNQLDIMVGELWDEAAETHRRLRHYGEKLGGERIHLYRNYRQWSKHKDYKKIEDKLFLLDNPDFLFGGRSGGYWQGTKKEDRPTLHINGNKTVYIDIPCCHLNLIYKHETKDWLQTKTHEELTELGSNSEDAYYLEGLERDTVKQTVLLMLNMKGSGAVTRALNQWLANKGLFTEITPKDIQKMITMKHHKIADYFYKGVLGGQVFQWLEANYVNHLAYTFTKDYEIPTLTVYDAFIVEREHEDIIKDFMYSTAVPDLYEKVSLMPFVKSF